MTTDRPLRYTSARVERSSRGLVRCIAQCTDCSWAEDAYLSAARSAGSAMRAAAEDINRAVGNLAEVLELNFRRNETLIERLEAVATKKDEARRERDE